MNKVVLSKVCAVGFNQITIPQKNTKCGIRTLVFYPTNEKTETLHFGPYSLNVALNGKIKESFYPLVVISHGTGGTPWVFRTLGHYLASKGFIIALPTHPGNNKDDNSLVDTIDILNSRPRDICQVISWFEKNAFFKPYVDLNHIGLIGHSFGGYSALAVAGGKPSSLPRESTDRKIYKIDTSYDKRVKAIVLLAPATIWYEENSSLKDVDCPIRLYVGEKDSHTGPCCPILEKSGHKEKFLPYGYHAHLVINGIPDKSKVQLKLVKNAGHFSFIAPFPKLLQRLDFHPSQDPDGFNREKYQNTLNKEIMKFLLSNLNASETGAHGPKGDES